jgi:hypothetical protein
MSRFYQKYLNGLPGKDSDKEEMQKKIDPTSMSLSKSTNVSSVNKGKLFNLYMKKSIN